MDLGDLLIHLDEKFESVYSFIGKLSEKIDAVKADCVANTLDLKELRKQFDTFSGSNGNGNGNGTGTPEAKKVARIVVWFIKAWHAYWEWSLIAKILFLIVALSVNVYVSNLAMQGLEWLLHFIK